MEIKRGDIYYADFNPVVGSEQGGIRPAVTIQNNVGNRFSPTIIVAPITSKPKKPMPTHVAVVGNGLEKDSIALLEQVRTLDKSRLGEFIGSISKQELKKIDAALGISFQLNIKEKNDMNLSTEYNDINNTKGAWIFARSVSSFRYGDIDSQVSILQSELKSEGYDHLGTCRVNSSIKADDDFPEVLEMFRAAQDKKISAVFVFSIQHFSENMDDACKIIDKLNSLGVLVYDNEGYQYSYDWFCKQTGKSFKGGNK